ncbi:MAG: helix-turn-helix transcriptional regulator [Clostridiales bacterium]|nr:helix-turn-helix transcriptional regulator [Clostridiales bacterium]
MNEEQNKEIGLRIADLRRAHKMTQENLAEKLDVSTKHISHVERGCASLSLNALIETCRIFDCTLDYIIFGRDVDPVLSLLPKTICDILHSDNSDDISMLIRYLQIYSELYNNK